MIELNITDCPFIYRNYSDILIDSFEIIQIVVGNGCGSLVRLQILLVDVSTPFSFNTSGVAE